jgi:predicted RNase H-like nuclease (RuvC/YqgF family)
MSTYHEGVERMRWTDERLDDAFAHLRGDIAELRADIRELRHELQEMRRWMIGMFGTMVIGMLAILAEVAIQG